MTPRELDAFYDILVEEAGAGEAGRREFVDYRQLMPYCNIDSSYGFRLCTRGYTVRLHSESAATPEYEAVIERTNKRLAEVFTASVEAMKS